MSGTQQSVEVTVTRSAIGLCYPLLQKGVALSITVGVSIMELLTSQFGIAPEYIKNKIQTIFLDGVPVDDEEMTIIEDGVTLALSSAMPGLAGAILRKGSHLKRMRREISSVVPEDITTVHRGEITMKFFNLLLPDLGRLFLEKGVWVDGKDVQELIKRCHYAGNGLIGVIVNGVPFPLEKLNGVGEQVVGRVFLTVKIEE